VPIAQALIPVLLVAAVICGAFGLGLLLGGAAALLFLAGCAFWGAHILAKGLKRG
jgi:hypothetical protein